MALPVAVHLTRTRAAAFAAAFSLASLVAGCIYIPRPVAGVPADQNWIALPLSGWIAEGEITIDAVSFCGSGDCPAGTVVATFEARGGAATELEKAIANPDRLARLLNDAARRREPRADVRTVTSAQNILIAGRPAVAVEIVRVDGSRSASAIVAGTRRAELLRVVLVIARTPEAATATAQGAIAARL